MVRFCSIELCIARVLLPRVLFPRLVATLLRVHLPNAAPLAPSENVFSQNAKRGGTMQNILYCAEFAKRFPMKLQPQKIGFITAENALRQVYLSIDLPSALPY